MERISSISAWAEEVIAVGVGGGVSMSEPSTTTTSVFGLLSIGIEWW
jgi:hypothetical protein